jgi:hypothetical protein
VSIDWLNPSDDVVEARRIGYEEGQNETTAELVDAEDEVEQLQALETIYRDQSGAPADTPLIHWLPELVTKVERLEAIVNPLNRLLAAAHVRVTFYADRKARGKLHISVTPPGVWRSTDCIGETLADALDKACKALLGEKPK